MNHRLTAAALAAVLACACSAQVDAKAGVKRAEDAPAAATANAAVTLDADQAKVWVVQLYDRFKDENWSPFGAPDQVFGPDIVRELAENDRLTPEGEQGAIDADPICSCQDPGGMTAEVLSSRMTGADTAEVKVKLQWPLPEDPIPSQIPDYTQHLTLQLQFTPAGWRVRDIGSAEARDSFLGYLKEANAEARKG